MGSPSVAVPRSTISIKTCGSSSRCCSRTGLRFSPDAAGRMCREIGRKENVMLIFEVTGEQDKELADAARRHRIPAEQLAAALVRDILAASEGDLNQLLARVLE